MANFLDGFDSYNRRARLYPAFLAASPAVVFVVLVWPDAPIRALGPVAVTLGGLFFLAQVVRSRGTVTELRLLDAWGGWPTTIKLRHREGANQVLAERRRQQLAQVTGVPLPTKSAELANPAAADDAYYTATRALIVRVRDREDKFPRVQEENTHYGFRRNTLALRPIALGISLTALVVDGLVLLIGGISAAALTCLGVHALISIAWLVVPAPAWVRQVADSYADRLFETLESPALTSA